MLRKRALLSALLLIFYLEEHAKAQKESDTAIEGRRKGGNEYTEVDNSNNLQYVSAGRFCSFWAPHCYRTFDGTLFRYTGQCRHVLYKDCVNGEAFNVVLDFSHCSIPMARKKRPTKRLGSDGFCRPVALLTAGEESISIRADPELSWVAYRLGQPMSIPLVTEYFNAQPVGRYLLIKTTYGARVWMAPEGTVTVELAKDWNRRTCGLCGLMDGNAKNDFQSPTRDLMDDSWSFGSSWMMRNPTEGYEEGCPDEERPTGVVCGRNSEANRDIANRASEICAAILLPKFSACHKVVDPKPYLEFCQQSCCEKGGSSGCECPTLLEYFSECRRSGGILPYDGWRTNDLCPMTCSNGMTYSECTPSCAPTCDNPYPVCDTSECLDGCKCPKDHVLQEGKCLPKSQCPCTLRNNEYPGGTKLQEDCNTCECVSGKWKCTKEICAAACRIIGYGQISTFDGLWYELPKTCTHHLLYVDGQSIQLENVPCRGTVKEGVYSNCGRNVIIKTGDNSPVIKLKKRLQVTVDGEEITTFPFTVKDVHIRMVSSLYIQALLPSGVSVTWSADGVAGWISVPPTFFGKTQGLCGTFSRNQADDLLTPEGDSELTPAVFARKWKTGAPCTVPTEIEHLVHPCEKNPHLKYEAEEMCRVMSADDSAFSGCRKFVDLDTYYGACLKEICGCHLPNRRLCLCPLLEHVAAECSLKAETTVHWRDDFPNCGIQCYGGQEYHACVNPCQYSCAQITPPFYSSRQVGTSECTNGLSGNTCLDGCSCPEGQALTTGADGLQTCTLLSECPCLYEGKEYSPGLVHQRNGESCTCTKGKWELCTPEGNTNAGVEHCKTGTNTEYSDCISDCPVTCLDLKDPPTCHTVICKSGCTCKKGFVLETTSGRCVRPSQCPCHHGGQIYQNGETRKMECNNCVCKEGRWICEMATCFGKCALYGAGHYKTFDDKVFDLSTGICSYTLVKGVTSTSVEGLPFSIISQNVPCMAASYKPSSPICRKDVTFTIGNESVTLCKDGSIDTSSKSTFKEQGFPSIFVFQEVGLFQSVRVLDLGIEISWDGRTRVYIHADPKWKGELQGLCGNFNGDLTDDFVGPSGGPPHSSAPAFADSWRVHPYCPNIAVSTGNPDKEIEHSCPEEKRTLAFHSCQILKNPPFESCHAEVDHGLYMERCIEDACDCKQVGGTCDCLCTAIAAYGDACAAKGVKIAWRNQDLCPIQCEESDHYSPCIDICPSNLCQHRLIEGEPDCRGRPCVEGCQQNHCPEGFLRNGTARNNDPCVPKANCDPLWNCLDDGKTYKHGDWVQKEGDSCKSCYCHKGVLDCKNTCDTTINPQIDGQFCYSDGWSHWLNSHTPTKESGGDYEILDNPISLLTTKIQCSGAYMTNIECRPVGPPRKWKEVDDIKCALPSGLVCNNGDGPEGTTLCEDYEIRVYCTCYEETETPPPEITTPTVPLPHSGPVCLPRNHGWTKWVNANNAGIDEDGDFETLQSVLYQGTAGGCPESNVTAIQCRVASDHRLWDDAKQNGVLCDLIHGLRCLNKYQPTGTKCLDYEIRAFCQCLPMVAVTPPYTVTPTAPSCVETGNCDCILDDGETLPHGSFIQKSCERYSCDNGKIFLLNVCSTPPVKSQNTETTITPWTIIPTECPPFPTPKCDVGFTIFEDLLEPCPVYRCACNPALCPRLIDLEPWELLIVTEYNGCCNKTVIECQKDLCPAAPYCLPEDKLVVIPGGSCCAKYECAPIVPPKDVCVYTSHIQVLDGYEVAVSGDQLVPGLYQPGEHWMDGLCRNCTCQEETPGTGSGYMTSCMLTECPDIRNNPDNEDYVLEQVANPGECCPKVVRIECKDDQGYRHELGSSWKSSDNPCLTFRCEVSPLGDVHKVQIEVSCPDCAEGSVYVPPPDKLETCCGTCKSVDCVEYGRTYTVGSFWNSTVRKCSTAECLTDGVIVYHGAKCPELSKNCPKDQIILDETGCCQICNPEVDCCDSEGHCVGAKWEDGPCKTCRCQKGGRIECSSPACTSPPVCRDDENLEKDNLKDPCCTPYKCVVIAKKYCEDPVIPQCLPGEETKLITLENGCQEYYCAPPKDMCKYTAQISVEDGMEYPVLEDQLVSAFYKVGESWMDGLCRNCTCLARDLSVGSEYMARCNLKQCPDIKESPYYNDYVLQEVPNPGECCSIFARLFCKDEYGNHHDIEGEWKSPSDSCLNIRCEVSAQGDAHKVERYTTCPVCPQGSVYVPPPADSGTCCGICKSVGCIEDDKTYTVGSTWNSTVRKCTTAECVTIGERDGVILYTEAKCPELPRYCPKTRLDETGCCEICDRQIDCCDSEGHCLGSEWKEDICRTCRCLKGGRTVCSTPACTSPPICREDETLEKYDLKNPCCVSYTCVPKPVLPCEPPVIPQCLPGEETKLKYTEDNCQVYFCVPPKDMCKYTAQISVEDGLEIPVLEDQQIPAFYKVGESWMDGLCRNCTCLAKDLSLGSEYMARCNRKQCPDIRDNPIYNDYVFEAVPNPGECCPKIARMFCKDTYGNSHDINSEWKSPDDNCLYISCKVSPLGDAHKVERYISCPDCPQGSEYVPPSADQGVCCGTCRPRSCIEEGLIYPVGTTWNSLVRPCHAAECLATEDGGEAIVVYQEIKCQPLPKTCPKEHIILDEAGCCKVCNTTDVCCDTEGHCPGNVWNEGGPCKECRCQKDGVTVCTVSQCPPPPVCRHDEHLVTETSKDPCCLYYECELVPKPECPPLVPLQCLPGELKRMQLSKEGCEEYVCEPPEKMCKYTTQLAVVDGFQVPVQEEQQVAAFYQVGQSWMDGLCRNCTCVEKDLATGSVYKPYCTLEQCPEIKDSDYYKDYVLEAVPNPGACCPKLARLNCKDEEGNSHEIGSGWNSPYDSCLSFTCKQSPLGDVHKVERYTSCPHCKEGTEYVPPADGSGLCCGTCVPVSCNEDGRTYQTGSTWNSTIRRCHTAECSDIGGEGGLKIVYHGPNCPDISLLEYCKKVIWDEQGCCQICEEPPKYTENICEYTFELTVEDGFQVSVPKDQQVPTLYQPGERWMDGLCRNCTCLEQNPAIGNGYMPSCRMEECLDIEDSPEFKEYVLEPVPLPGKCCPELVRTMCKDDDGNEKDVGVEWKSSVDNCLYYKCEVTTRGDAHRIERYTECPKCTEGTEYVPPSASKGKCCGWCRPISCEESGNTYHLGYTWTSRIRRCHTARCSVTEEGVSVVYKHFTCPRVSRTCPEAQITWDEDGCCQICNTTVDPMRKCKPTLIPEDQTVGYLVAQDPEKGQCTNAVALQNLKQCEGHCESRSLYSIDDGSFKSNCECCTAENFESFEVWLKCEGGDFLKKVFHQPTNCICSPCSGSGMSPFEEYQTLNKLNEEQPESVTQITADDEFNEKTYKRKK